MKFTVQDPCQLVRKTLGDPVAEDLRFVVKSVVGEENFIDCIIWKKRYGGGAKEKYLVSVHEYALFYAKSKETLAPLFIPTDDESIARYYKLKDENFEKRGHYRTHPLEATKSMGERKNLVFPIKAPDGTSVLPKLQWCLPPQHSASGSLLKPLYT